MSNVRSGREIDSALRRKGFRRERDGKHVHYFFVENPMVVTHMSHGMMGSSIDANLMSRMARQLHLSRKQFLNFIDCLLDAASYRVILLEQR